MVKKTIRYVKPFSSDTGMSRTDRRTDGQTDRIAISISRVSVLTRDKKLSGVYAKLFYSCTIFFFTNFSVIAIVVTTKIKHL